MAIWTNAASCHRPVRLLSNPARLNARPWSKGQQAALRGEAQKFGSFGESNGGTTDIIESDDVSDVADDNKDAIGEDVIDDTGNGGDELPPWLSPFRMDTRINLFAVWILGESARSAVVPLIEAANETLEDAGSEAVLSWPAHSGSGTEIYWGWCTFRDVWNVAYETVNASSFHGPVCGVVVDDTESAAGSTYWGLFSYTTHDDSLVVKQDRTESISSGVERCVVDRQVFMDGDLILNISGEWVREAPVSVPALDSGEIFAKSAIFRFPLDVGVGVVPLFTMYIRRVEFTVINRFADPAVDRTEGDFTLEFTNLPEDLQAIFGDPDNTLMIFRERIGDDLLIEVTE